MMNFDPLNQDKQANGVFNSFVDSLVIKILNSNDILIINKTLNVYIQYIKENYENVNDYIFKNSFNELKKVLM
jgi:hypothetical protein